MTAMAALLVSGVISMNKIKIPGWIDVLARIRPFGFCERCVAKIKEGKLSLVLKSWHIAVRWAQFRCITCGGELEINVKNGVKED